MFKKDFVLFTLYYLYQDSGRPSVCVSACLCVCVSDLLRDGWTYLLHSLGKDIYFIWLTLYLYFMTLGQMPRSLEVIGVISLFISV